MIGIAAEILMKQKSARGMRERVLQEQTVAKLIANLGLEILEAQVKAHVLDERGHEHRLLHDIGAYACAHETLAAQLNHDLFVVHLGGLAHERL